ncbi:uncharacterized protein LOC105437440 [Strongylocentrotus purpuratus]|uniref:Uncharacterized protein n=1 Tax=Strongylocentrotus purpuratus TaxID=7668 RepID=A0A7M7MYE6_STRPU|nr:uncharacterized protein LOC105437440 [Strongylocentrotus purpuratus]
MMTKWIGRRKTLGHPTMRTRTEELKVGRGAAVLTAKSVRLRGTGTGPALAPAPASAGRRRAKIVCLMWGRTREGTGKPRKRWKSLQPGNWTRERRGQLVADGGVQLPEGEVLSVPDGNPDLVPVLSENG